MHFSTIAIGLCALAGLTGCDIFTGNIEDGKNKLPLAISLIEGDGQAATVGQSLPKPLTVKVVNRLGQPVADVPVFFSVQQGTATLNETAVATAGSGQAAVQLTLGDNPGAVVVVASADGAVNTDGTLRTATFNLQAVAGTAQTLEKSGGDNQEGRAATVLPQPLKVRLLDGSGNGIPGAEVHFTPVSLVGANQANQNTDSDGQAAITVTASTQAGDYQITASAQGLTATFRYRSLPDDASLRALEFKSDSEYAACNSSDTTYEINKPVGKPVAVLVQDIYFNPVPDQTVQFTVNSGGSVNPAMSYTDKNGVATTTATMGGGDTSVVAQVAGVTPKVCVLKAAPK